MKKFIVTGGLGFIGSNLIKILLDKNYYVINIDKITYASNFYNVKNYKKNRNYKFIKCDTRNQKKILSIFKKYKPKGIFNLAAETHVDRSIDGPRTFIENNINGTFSILEATRKYLKKNKNFRLLHVSTDEVYGDVLKSRSKEKDAYKPSSPYAASKASSDHLVYSYIRTYKINAVITNCSNNYGPNQHPEKLIPKLIYNILNNKELPIYGKGKNSREWIHVEDHCNALLKVLLKGKTGEFYNIGSNTNYNNYDLAKKLLKISRRKLVLGKKVRIRFVKDRPGHDMRYAINSDKIKKRLKWKPKINLDKGLLNTFEWYIKNKKFFKNINKKQIIKRLGIIND
tara:strand:+ start:619 stop:1644 length:1026 start_codon:yes stop_codon:yes gene_type:complete